MLVIFVYKGDSARNLGDGTNILVGNPIGGLRGDRCARVVRPFLRKIVGHGAVHEEHSSQASTWFGSCQAGDETVSPAGSWPVRESYSV